MPDSTLVSRVGALLAQHGLRLILSESMTGGAVVAALLSSSGHPCWYHRICIRFGPLDVAKKYQLNGDPYEIVGEAVTLVLLLLEDRLHQLEE